VRNAFVFSVEHFGSEDEMLRSLLELALELVPSVLQYEISKLKEDTFDALVTLKEVRVV